MARMKFMNTEIDNLTMEESLDAIEDLISKKKNSYIITPNVDDIVQLEYNDELKEIFENASLLLTDGQPLIWISKWYGTPIKEKVSGADLFPRICERAAEKGYSMYFLGAAEGVAARAAKNLSKKYKGLNVVGTYSPPYGFEKDDQEVNKIIKMINEASPDILIVGLGFPKQEKFIYKYRDRLNVPVSLGLGASIDFEAGEVKRAPKWMSDHGLEWLYRIIQDPKRLAKRYLVDDRKILRLAIKYKPSENNKESSDLKKQNVLMIARTMGLGGTENVVLQLCKILKPYVNKIVVCSSGGINTTQLEQMGIKHYGIPDITQKDLKTMKFIYKTLNEIIDEEEITIVHTHHRMAVFYAELLYKKKNIKFVSTAHNTFYDKKLLTKFSYKHSKVIACGEMVKKNLVEFYGLPSQQIKVIHNAVEPFDGNIEIDPLLDELKKKNKILVGNVGRLSEQKGMEYFIKSLPEVLKSFPNVMYVIVGDGEDREKLYNLVDELCLNDNVIFLGYRNDIRNVMSQLDFIVLSSLWEGLPLTPIEAFSVKKTVIGTAVDGTIEIIKDNENGFLIEPNNPKMIAEKVIMLCKDEKLKSNFEESAYNTFINEFSIAEFGKKILEFYNSL